jgi:hypothetical protein
LGSFHHLASLPLEEKTKSPAQEKRLHVPREYFALLALQTVAKA